MKTLANYIVQFIIFISIINHIQSLNSGESVFDKKIVVLDAISDWSFRQANDEINNFNKQSISNNKQNYFLINEQKNLDLVIKDNPNFKTRFTENLDKKCKKLKVTYSFDYYLDFFATVKIFKWSIYLLRQKTEIKPIDETWTSVSKSLEINLKDLKENYNNTELFAMYINTIDIFGNDNFKDSFQTKFAIKNLKIILSCRSARNELKFELNPTNNSDSNSFIFERNGNILTNYEQIDFWTNSIFPPFSNGTIDKYYCSEKSLAQLNLVIDAQDLKQEQEICLTFDYFISKDAHLIVDFLDSSLHSRTLIKLFNTEFNERLVNDKVDPKHSILKWNNATVCINGDEILEKGKDKVPQWIFKSVIEKPELKTDIIAVTNFKVEQKDIRLKSFIPTWKLDGKNKMKDWILIPKTPNFILNVSNDQQLKLILRELPSKSKRHYSVISDWFQIVPGIGNLTFKIDSNLTDYYLRLKVQSEKSGLMGFKTWKLEGPIKEKVLEFNLKENILFNDQIKSFRGKIKFEIYNNQLTGSDLSNFSAENGEENSFENHVDEQMLIISEIQLADRCSDETICNRRGVCKTLSANLIACECKSEYHGSNCQFDNLCEKKIKIGGSDKTGKEFCKLHKRNCIPEEGRFSCECGDGEYWNEQEQQCKIVTVCNFHTCGLNEQCKIGRDKKPFCECKPTYVRNKKTNNICLKDLCTDPDKKCPKNQLCLHVENEVNPICYCPFGLFKLNDEGECIDIRKNALKEITNPYENINPFVLQKYGCDQNYEIEDDKVTCSCLPGYTMYFHTKKCNPQFELKGCKCKKNQICIQKEDKTKECVCKPGFFGQNCEENFCSLKEAQDSCGPNSCHLGIKASSISDNKFICNCTQELYNTNKETGLCEFKDVCTETGASCSDEGVCFNQMVKSDRNQLDKYKISSSCGCKRGLKGNGELMNKCVDSCYNDSGCSDLPFTRCRLFHEFDEIRCQCNPGFWRKNILADPCSPVKSSIRLNLMIRIKNTNVNPVRKKDRRKTRNDSTFFATSISDKNNDHFFVSASNTSFNTRKTIKHIRTGRSIAKSANEENIKHFPISSITYPCHGNLDLEGCVRNWNSAFQSANALPDNELSYLFIESLLRNVLFDTFSIIFNKKVQGVSIISHSPFSQLDVNNFGLKTDYNVDFVLQSNDLDLTESMVRNALDKNCVRESSDESNEKYYECSIDEQSLLYLNYLEVDKFDLCETGALTCPPNNYCYSKRSDPSYDFKNDKVAYECRCKEGFKSVHVNDPGFFSFLNHTCEDIDECESPDLNECDGETTTCTNLIGSYRCDCDNRHKRFNATHCTPLCSQGCVNGDCVEINEHEDYCKCYDEWSGLLCDQPNAKVSNYKNSIIIIITVSIVLLTLIVIGLVIFGRRYVQRKIAERTTSLNQELQMTKTDNQRLRSAGISSGIRTIQPTNLGKDNPAFK